ncbi:hypothetical protein CDD83_8662 [Cordyceps sp. RAO-2017]|nr:hypothetical protein CDD83_8662 [Cordyceps sp. RAO-2017]
MVAGSRWQLVLHRHWPPAAPTTATTGHQQHHGHHYHWLASGWAVGGGGLFLVLVLVPSSFPRTPPVALPVAWAASYLRASHVRWHPPSNSCQRHGETAARTRYRPPFPSPPAGAPRRGPPPVPLPQPVRPKRTEVGGKGVGRRQEEEAGRPEVMYYDLAPANQRLQ